MAGVRRKPNKNQDGKLTELKDEIAKVVASEGGKIDASLIRKKYEKHFDKTIDTRVLKNTKLTSFIKQHMSDVVDVIQEGTATFIKSKTKRKDATTIGVSAGQNNSESVPMVPMQYHSTKNMNNDNKGDIGSSIGSVNNSMSETIKQITETPNVTEFNTDNVYQSEFPSLNVQAQLPRQATAVTCLGMQHQRQMVYHHVNLNSNKCSTSSKVLNLPKDDRIKNEVDRIIDELSKNHHVEVDLVKKQLLERFKVQKVTDLVGRRKMEDIPVIKDLLRKHREINASIQAFVMVRSVSTLHELGKYLARLYPGAEDYEDLKLGPLVKHPLVYQYFKFPSNLDPPEITTLRVMKYLREFVRKNGWTNKVDMAEFLEYLKEQMSCETLFEIGVKIDSLGLMIKCVKSCCSVESGTRREAEQRLMEEIADEIEQQMKKIKKQLLGSYISDPDALVNKLSDLSPVDVLQRLFEYCEKFFQGKAKKKVTEFVRMCTSDKPSRKLFQLALHKCCRDLVKPVDDFRQQNDATNPAGMVDETLQTTTHDDNLGGENSCPAQQELVNEVKRWLAGNSSKSGVDLKQLARVEDSVLHHYKGITTFRDLGQGTFLQFLSEHQELETLIRFSDHAEKSALGVRKSEVISLLQQCGVDSEKTKLHKAVRAQYKNLSTNLDETTLDALIARAREQGSQHGKTSFSVVYEACLVADNLDTIHVQGGGEDRQKGAQHVGVLGYQDKSNALTCLHQTPLLEDLITWSEWDRVFAPMYGELKSFLKQNSLNQSVTKDDDKGYPGDLVAMETSTGSLLRITRVTSTDVLLKCAKRGDVIGTSGHLVSLVFQYGGVKKAPLALLAGHMKEAFLSLNAIEESKSNEESTEIVIKFAIRCLSRVPPLMRHSLGMKIFLEPLMFVFGNGQTPSLVLKYCKTFEERCLVHSLGIQFGVSEWQEDFKKKFEIILSHDEEQEETTDAFVLGEGMGIKNLESEAQVEKESFDTKDGALAEEMSKNEINEHDFTDENIKFPEDSAITSEKEDKCRAVVECIRREEFGIGIELEPKYRQMMENQRSREGRGLYRLSSELYSKDTHFVLELVQNADDNRYLSLDNTPSITFFVSVEKIEVCNNEVGFEERNIRALCDVGKSTKGKQRYGYIGQKGIGFKSVFRITDTPEVHSNGYHIKFDAKSGPTGYILPHWCAANTDENIALNDWTTRIVLPLKNEMKEAQKRTLIARFHDIQPSLLLFLRRLRQIKIHDEVSKTTREMIRRDCGDKLTEITHSNGVDLWFVVKKELSASTMKEDIESTEIALAFPLPPRMSASTISLDDVTAFIQAKSLIQQPVFAFLPLRSYGFRFIIQADFDVPSSREDVDKDSAWNQWLRQEIAGLFVQTFDDFKVHECFLGVSSIVQLLQFIPLEDEILDFFKPLTQTIREGISRKRCIPVLVNAATHGSIFNMDTKSDHSDAARDNKVEIKWVFPSQVIVAEDYLIEELISDKILNRYLNKYYLHPDLRSYLHAPLRRVLGIETISCQHLIEIGKAVASKIEDKLDTPEGDSRGIFESFAHWVAKWLCSIYRCLERERDCSDETLQEIAQINIFPLSSGRCTPISGEHIFLPLEEKIKGEQTKSKVSRKAVEIVHRELHSLHPLILTSLDDIGRSQARKLLQRLQVRCLTSRDLIKHHIVPALQAAQNKSVNNPEVIYSYIVYIKDQWDLDQGVCNLQELHSCALIKTNKGFVNPSLEPVHFTVDYGNKTDLQRDFPSVPWTVIDNGYITSASSNESQVSWEKYLSALGVVHFLAIERKDVSLSKSLLSSSIWSSLSSFWKVTANGNYIIKDYGSSELEILLSNGSNDELKKLAEILDQHWDDLYSNYTKDVPYLDEQGQLLGETSSSFFLNLKEKCWLPTRTTQSSTKPPRSCPRNVFMPKQEVVSLLGDHALYATPSLVNEKFLKALGIRTSVKFDTLVSELMKWVGNDDLDCEFTTSLEHMTNVYTFLESQINHNDEKKKYLEDVTKNRPVVFVPSPPDNTSGSKVLGTFLARKRVYWSDPTNLMEVLREDAFTLADPRRMLKSYYPNDVENFFVKFLRIDASPNVKEYLNLLETIASQSTIAGGPIVDNMMRVYDVIATNCLKAQDPTRSTNFVKTQLLNLKVFPTTEEKWVSLEEKPLFSDDKSLAKLFREFESQKKADDASHAKSNEEKVHFIRMGLQPKRRKERRGEAEKTKSEEAENSRIRKSVQKFYKEVCDIRNLSECVSVEIIATLTSECPALQSFLVRSIPYIQRFLYSKHFEHHEQLQESGMATALSNVRCFGAKELEVVHRLSTHPTITVPITKTCGIERKDMLTFYVTDSELNDTGDIIKELAQQFCPTEIVNDLKNFLYAVLNQRSDDDVESYMAEQDLDVLPEEVAAWTVPEPPPIQVPMKTEPPDESLPHPDSVISPESEGPSVMQESDGEPRGLQCWPPKCPGTSGVHGITSKNPVTEQALTAAWTPPAPPDAYVRPNVEVFAAGAQNVVQVHPQHLSDQVTSPTTDESSPQPVIRLIHTEPNVSSVRTNDTHDHNIQHPSNTTDSNPARTPYDDVTHQQHPQYIRPLELSDVRAELEEVDLGNTLRGTELISLTQNANAENVGRWGEECVYILLKSIEGRDQVVWMNEQRESGLPYDIVIKGEGMEVFIEVKSTSSLEKHVLEISSQEIKCAFERQENYHVYRVYNAGNPRDCRVARLRNLASNLDTKAVSLFILI